MSLLFGMFVYVLSTLPALAQTTKPATKPTSRVVKQAGKRGVPQPAQPFRTGWLSFTLSGEDQIWLDGREMGMGGLAYLRVLAGRHHLRLKHPKYGTKSLYINVWAGRHVAVIRKGERIGFRRFRSERSHAKVRRYYLKGKPKEEVVEPGLYCVRPFVCLVLMPGEHLYIRPDGRYNVMPPQNAVRSVRSYRSKPGDGFLTLYSYPPGALFLNKRMYAVTPVARLPLKPGRYSAWLRNGYLNMEWRGWIVIKAGKEVRKVVMTTPRKGANLVVLSKRPASIKINGKFHGWTPAHVLPLPPGKYQVELKRPNGQRWKTTVELMPGQLEIVRWKK